jgi:hypothetical protein
MAVFVVKVYCVSCIQNHENKSLRISKNVFSVPLLDMTFFRCGLYEIINFAKKCLGNITL